MQHISETKIFTLTAVLSIIAILVMNNFFGYGVISAMILTHVSLGGLAFLIGAVTLFSKKGSPIHKQSGKVFYHSMVVSVAITLIVSVLPGHVSPTMFHIGILSLYFLLGGKRSINFKKPAHNLQIDQLLAYLIVSLSLVIMSYSVIKFGNLHPLRTVFGVIGIGFGIFDLMYFRKPEQIKKKWLVLHLSKMLGGYTAAVTAFFVAQNILNGYFNWFTPTVVGLSYIFFWMYKLNIFKPVLKA